MTGVLRTVYSVLRTGLQTELPLPPHTLTVATTFSPLATHHSPLVWRGHPQP
jgi:hypothetical protein